MQQAIFSGRQDIVEFLFKHNHRATIVTDLSKVAVQPQFFHDLVINFCGRAFPCHFGTHFTKFQI